MVAPKYGAMSWDAVISSPITARPLQNTSQRRVERCHPGSGPAAVACTAVRRISVSSATVFLRWLSRYQSTASSSDIVCRMLVVLLLIRVIGAREREHGIMYRVGRQRRVGRRRIH